MTTTKTTSRRTFLGALAGTAIGVGALAEPAAAQEGGLGAWFENVSNANEIVDQRGQSTVEITVGTKGNDGNFGFGPAAVRVDAGATVVWKWNGKGGSHNVVAQEGGFESEMHSEQGTTFEHSFDSSGMYRYYCAPHKAMGMKGAVVVGDATASLSGGAGADSDGGGANASATGASDTPRSFDGWLSNTGNYEGVVDRTGNDVVSVKVGVEGNGGPYAFDPPAIHVDPGTTVIWEWVTDTGPHDVVDTNGQYQSEKVATAGHQFAMKFGGDGLSKYECVSHSDRGMRGAVIVGRGVVPGLGPTGLVVASGGAAVLGGVLHQGIKLHNETATGPWSGEESA
ncbi:halocyanin domain-containing protein [Halococcus saccharolyticus]|uniref:Plastocyanin n=1 Tax=Halococcus saccharolyticus DSM 5350 TaxID=1227455 RepID=M0ML40_9EURY|nr:halocyanin domain-containing protein [Halococcus saccharolyticus]EMA46078.1 plastocyanin [Halococcus saccharolyticus DSM 5350]